MQEIFFKIPSSEYNDGFVLNEYHKQGETDCFYLSAGGKTREGNVYKKWAFPQDKDRQPKEIALPVSVKLGNREEAIKLLQGVLKELSNDSSPF